MARVFIIKLVILYTFIYNIPQRIYTQFLPHVFSLPSLLPILFIFSRCIRTRGPLANRRAGLLRLAVSPASLRGWRRRRLTPSPYISHYISPTDGYIGLTVFDRNEGVCIYEYACSYFHRPISVEKRNLGASTSRYVMLLRRIIGWIYVNVGGDVD